MTKELEFDPRTKLIIVMCISTLGIIIKDSLPLFLILILTILIAKLFKINLKRSFKKTKRLLYVVILIAIIQSIFSTEGRILLSAGNFIILSTTGLAKEFAIYIANDDNNIFCDNYCYFKFKGNSSRICPMGITI